MASFCASCGSAVEGRFCAKCGTAVAGAPPASGGYVPPQPAGGPATGEMAENVASALCYAVGLVTGIIFLVLAPYNQNRNIRFHAFQSIFLHVGVVALYMVLGIMLSVLHIFVFWSIWPLIGLALFVLWIYLIVSAYQGKRVVLPVIGELAAKQA